MYLSEQVMFYLYFFRSYYLLVALHQHVYSDGQWWNKQTSVYYISWYTCRQIEGKFYKE